MFSFRVENIGFCLSSPYGMITCNLSNCSAVLSSRKTDQLPGKKYLEAACRNLNQCGNRC